MLFGKLRRRCYSVSWVLCEVKNLAVIIAIPAALLISAPLVYASASAKAVFDNQYPTVAAQTSCFACHTGIPGTPGTRTAYGQDYVGVGSGTSLGNSAALVAIENLDSDGDGVSNIDEINAGTLAPVSSTQNKGCVMTSASTIAMMVLTLLLFAMFVRRKRSDIN